MAEISLETRTEGELVIDTILWTLPHWDREQHNQKRIKEFTTTSRHLSSLDAKYLLKLMCLLDSDVVELYFLSKLPVCVKSKLHILDSQSRFSEIAVTDHHILRPNVWLKLAELDKNKIWFSSSVKAKLKIEFMVKKVLSQTLIPVTQLSQDLQCLMNEGLHSDVTLKSTEGVKFKAHKAVLASRSPVLKANFQHNTVECVTNVVDCPFNSDVLKDVLMFIYCNKAKEIDKIPHQLLVAADYYQLNELKNLCEFALHKKLAVENAIETLQLADTYSAGILKQLTMEYIHDGRIPSILKTEGWVEIECSKLIKELFEFCCTDDQYKK